MDFSGAGSTFYALWRTLTRLPAGDLLFSRLLGLITPYTGSIHARVLLLEPGRARVELREHRAVRNHLNSVHAIALLNLAEMTSGLALMVGLPRDARGIPVELGIEYLKKARGHLIAECSCTPPSTSERQELTIHATITDEADEEVARVRARWLIGPKGSPKV
jgi:acyl-coenzyme A thioesterase PaaI-like protein